MGGGRPCGSVTLPPDMDTSKIGRWFSRLTINSWMPWSDRVTAADEAAHHERHPDGQGAQGELAQAETVKASAARPAVPHIFRIRIISPSQCM